MVEQVFEVEDEEETLELQFLQYFLYQEGELLLDFELSGVVEELEVFEFPSVTGLMEAGTMQGILYLLVAFLSSFFLFRSLVPGYL